MRPETPYVPGAGDDWETRRPEQVGMAGAALEEAVAFAVAHETPWATDLEAVIRETHADEGPFAEIIGPTRPRGGPNGLVLRHGYLVAEWGDTARADMTFSASKSYLATVAGLALDRGLIRSVDDPVREYVDDGGFDSAHNRAITWRHLLQQTSEWEGTLWGKPDQVDRIRAAPAPPTRTDAFDPWLEFVQPRSAHKTSAEVKEVATGYLSSYQDVWGHYAAEYLNILPVFNALQADLLGGEGAAAALLADAKTQVETQMRATYDKYKTSPLVRDTLCA